MQMALCSLRTNLQYSIEFCTIHAAFMTYFIRYKVSTNLFLLGQAIGAGLTEGSHFGSVLVAAHLLLKV